MPLPPTPPQLRTGRRRISPMFVGFTSPPICGAILLH
ncbi:Uncharacterised protein [Vibrio cholerae]|nr:Uncharacterised protein [Vibrio cholerae]